MKTKHIAFLISSWMVSLLFILLGIIPMWRSIFGIGTYINAGWFGQELYEALQSYSLLNYIMILIGEILLILSGL